LKISRYCSGRYGGRCARRETHTRRSLAPRHYSDHLAGGIPGSGRLGSSQYLTESRRELGRERFDLVIVSAFLGNDVVPRRIERYPPGPPADTPIQRLLRRSPYGELVEAVLYPVDDFLKARSQLFALPKNQTTMQRRRFGLTHEYFPQERLRR
jgi:hypothetical protein